MSTALIHALVDMASEPYRATGRLAHHFARAKLRADPVFAAILEFGLLGRRRHILDLGCGQGLLCAWLMAAQRLAGTNLWPAGWPAPPQSIFYRGIEVAARCLARARTALKDHGNFTLADVRRADFGRADGIVILDVLHYIEYADQHSVLERARRALDCDGVLLLRIGDAAGGLGFTLSRWVDQMVLLVSGRGFQRLHSRTLAEWRALLSSTGFDSRQLPMSAGTPFANVLLIATPR